MKLFKKLGILVASFAMGVGAIGSYSKSPYFKSLASESLAYTIDFKNNTSSVTALTSSVKASTFIASGSTSYVASSPVSNVTGNCYYGDTQESIRIGKSGNSASLTLNLSDNGKVNATKVEVSCYCTGNKNIDSTLAVNGSSAISVPNDTYGTISYTFDGSTLESIVLSSTKSTYIDWIKVYVDVGSGSDSSSSDDSSESQNDSSDSSEDDIDNNTVDYTFDLMTDTTNTKSADQVLWTSSAIRLILDKNGSSVSANNYLGGNSGYTHTRMYNKQSLTFEPSTGIEIVLIEIVCTTSTKAGYFGNFTYSNATYSITNTTVSVVPIDGLSNIVITNSTSSASEIKTVVVSYIDNSGNTDSPTCIANIEGLKTMAKLSYDVVDNRSKIDFSKFDYSNDTELTNEVFSSSDNAFTLSFSKDDGAIGVKYYEPQIRVYKQSKICINLNKAGVAKIVLEIGGTNNSPTISADKGNLDTTGNIVWTGSSETTQVVFSIGGSGHYRINGIIVQFSDSILQFMNAKMYFGITTELSKINALKTAGYTIESFNVAAMIKSVVPSNGALRTMVINNTCPSQNIVSANQDLSTNADYITDANSKKTANGSYISFYSCLSVPSANYLSEVKAVAFIKVSKNNEERIVALGENVFSIKTLVDSYISLGYGETTKSLFDFQNYLGGF